MALAGNPDFRVEPGIQGREDGPRIFRMRRDLHRLKADAPGMADEKSRSRQVSELGGLRIGILALGD